MLFVLRPDGITRTSVLQPWDPQNESPVERARGIANRFAAITGRNATPAGNPATESGQPAAGPQAQMSGACCGGGLGYALPRPISRMRMAPPLYPGLPQYRRMRPRMFAGGDSQGGGNLPGWAVNSLQALAQAMVGVPRPPHAPGSPQVSRTAMLHTASLFAGLPPLLREQAIHAFANILRKASQ